MYVQVKPYKKFITGTGAEMAPLATLVDDDDGSGDIHIVVEAGCYVAYLYNEATGFVPTYYIFSELHALLAKLGDPMEVARG